MSADNGIYILITAKPPIKEDGGYYVNQDGYEYRVAHCQNIDDLNISDLYMALLFGDSPVFSNYTAAKIEAENQSYEYEYLEYGISTIDMSHKYFPNMTSRAAQKALDIYEGAEPLDYKKE